MAHKSTLRHVTSVPFFMSKSILNIKVDTKLVGEQLAHKVELVLGNINFGSSGTLQIGVHTEYLPAYLSLEYGTAGERIPEKDELFPKLAASVVIPSRRKLTYSKMFAGKKRGYIVILGAASKTTLYEGFGLPMTYSGVPPQSRGIVRGLKGSIIAKVKSVPKRVLKQRFGKQSPSSINMKNDPELQRLYREELIVVGEEVKEMLQSRTPRSMRSAERMGQIERWNANHPNEQRPTGHLKDDGYFVNYIDKKK